MNSTESIQARWFVWNALTAMVIGVLATTILLISPVSKTLADDALGRPGAPTHHDGVRVVAGLRGTGISPSAIVTGPLDGEPTLRSDAQRRAIAVTIDNYYPDARPQTGLGDASLVFETLVEGGYTRLLAVYLEHNPTVVGPVRSTRIYFDDWAAAYHAVLVHVGGNDDADAQLWQMRPVYNLDEGSTPFMLANSNSYYWRSATRWAPDNMYASVSRLRAYAASRRQDWRYSSAWLPHKALEPASDRGRSGTLTITFVDPLYSWVPANPGYQVQFRFDPASDSYVRVDGGAIQIDAATHQPISARNVVVMHTGAGAPDLAAGTTVDAVSIPVIGSGSAEFYRDGWVEHGTWRQKDTLAPLQFLNRQGTPVTFNPGQTWIEVLPQYSTAAWTFQHAR